MSPTNRLGYLLQHTASILARQYDVVLQKELGLGMAQFKILMILQHGQHIQQNKLADCLGQTEASISRQIKLLAKAGLLEVQVTPDNRRQHIASVTAKGAALTSQALEILKNYSAPIFDSLTAAQKQQLESCLEVLHQHTCAAGKPFACNHSFDK
ncbi:MAG TPA: MarR family transcriptional regulator [Candidatus Acidoferrum sp.]|nr:MarR family transcriptional regulator [Candidatus Acidoferrum sp.]